MPFADLRRRATHQKLERSGGAIARQHMEISALK
jgi:hypothetical protein